MLILKLKHDDVLIDASVESAAFVCAFKMIDEAGFYEELDGKDQKAFYKAAKKDDFRAARRLMECRRSYEYEGWELKTVIEPDLI